MATESSMVKQEELDKLPKSVVWDSRIVYQWEGFWYSAEVIRGMLAFQSDIQPRNDDVVLASSMKTGTTWLKALCVCIMGDDDDDQLQVKNPHEHINVLEYEIYKSNPHPDLSALPSPRLFHTHLPYSALPDSIKNSDCKIVYIARNPKDTLVSFWRYLNKVFGANQESYPFEKAYADFCQGVHFFGPYLDHALQYWSESLKMPHRILFLKYEELKKDPKEQVKRLASFLGRPFVNEDEVDKVQWRSSLDRLKNLEVNKNGVVFQTKIPNSSFFRLGVVGDWKNYFTPEMEQNLDEITRRKLEGSGLNFETN